jgi:flagellar hook-basal body protein
LENVANNLANSSTAGFRKRRLQFEDLLYQSVVMPGAASTQQTTVAAGLQIGLGTRSAASEIVQSQGDFSHTGNSLDLAIEGQGFFSGNAALWRNRLHPQRGVSSRFSGQYCHCRWQPHGSGDKHSA